MSKQKEDSSAKTQNPSKNQNAGNVSSDQNAYKVEGFTPKRIAALIGCILLISLYIITLIVAIFDRSQGGKWFMISMSATFAIPFLIWIYIWIYGQLTGKKTIADLNYNIGANNADAAAGTKIDAVADSKIDPAANSEVDIRKRR